MYIRCADLPKFWCITACGDTQFNVNSHMRKRVFPRTWICTVLNELPYVETHKSMCKSMPAEIRYSPCGNSHEIVHFRMWKYTKNCGFPKIHIQKFERESEFPHVNLQADSWISTGEKHAGMHDFSGISTCGNTCGNVNSRLRKYTGIGVLPHVVIH